MIKKECMTTEWIKTMSVRNKYKDLNLIEKVIRAMSLLEMLKLSGCPFCFKGGSALMLILGESAHRLSIDIDIICPPGTDIEPYLKESIDSILAIDKKTRELVENTDKEIEGIKKDLREKLTDLENESIEKSKLLGKERSDEILRDFEKKADDLREENKKNLEEIEDFYKKNSEDLIRIAFDKLIGRDSNV